MLLVGAEGVFELLMLRLRLLSAQSQVWTPRPPHGCGVGDWTQGFVHTLKCASRHTLYQLTCILRPSTGQTSLQETVCKRRESQLFLLVVGVMIEICTATGF